MKKLGTSLLAAAIVSFSGLWSCGKESRELSETLQWMDNTYNPHENWSYGHGKTGWYNSDKTAPDGEILVSGSHETFTYDGCRTTLRVEDNPYSTAHKDVYGISVYSFNLSDINPASVKVNTYSHLGGFRCEDYKADERELFQMSCDHAEVTFSTRTEAPLINVLTDVTYAKLAGKDHTSKGKSKDISGYFEVDDVQYAARFAQAFQRAVELCGGKASPL
jgi:hypothetical protein